MSNFAAIDSKVEARIRETFGLQKVMSTLGASLTQIQVGQVQIRWPYNLDFTQHNGFLHAGIVTTIVDTACGCAAYTQMSPESGVLTVEFKVNFLSPAKGDYFVATGQVIKAGQTITVCEGRVVAYTESSEKLIAVMQATMIQVNSS